MSRRTLSASKVPGLEVAILACAHSAATPATCGTAMLVPSLDSSPPSLDAETIPTPGAQNQGPWLENAATSSCPRPPMPTAPTERTPEAPAVSDDASCLSYRELHGRANRLARLLVSEGVGPEDLVAVSMPRGSTMLVAILAVLKAGAAYVPLDPSYPADRKEAILGDAAPVLGLSLRESTVDGMPGRWLVLDDGDVADRLEPLPANALHQRERRDALAPDNVAYAIFTSGSTGRPKGVLVSHRNVASFVTWAVNWFGPQRLAHTLAATSLNFDVSVFEMFAPLACGGRLEVVRDLLALAERSEGWTGSLISGVPSALAHVLRDGEARVLSLIHI